MNLTRRDFAKLSTLALAARFVQNLHAGTSAPRKTGYCVIGLGRIAGHFMPAVRSSTTSQITGLVSGHRDKAERIAAEYGVPSSSIYNYENFDEIAHNPAIDAVYVALPNSMHAEYAIRAAKAGKHVLCEKPMSTNVADAEAMIAACKAARVKLMIAYRCHYEPTNLKAIHLIRKGALGQVQAIESSFGFNIAPGEWRLSKKLAGGGPLFDVGIYSLNACRCCALTVGAHNLTNSTQRATLRTSRPKPTTFPTASKTGWSRSLRAKKVCATCATSRRFTARRELQFKACEHIQMRNRTFFGCVFRQSRGASRLLT